MHVPAKFLTKTRPVNSEYKWNGSTYIAMMHAESGPATTQDTQNVPKSTFVFGSVKLEVSLCRNNCFFL